MGDHAQKHLWEREVREVPGGFVGSTFIQQIFMSTYCVPGPRGHRLNPGCPSGRRERHNNKRNAGARKPKAGGGRGNSGGGAGAGWGCPVGGRRLEGAGGVTDKASFERGLRTGSVSRGAPALLPHLLVPLTGRCPHPRPRAAVPVPPHTGGKAWTCGVLPRTPRGHPVPGGAEARATPAFGRFM